MVRVACRVEQDSNGNPLYHGLILTMTWTDSDHNRLVALKKQRAEMMRVPDEQVDKPKIRKVTIKIKEIRARLIAHEKGLDQPEATEEATEESTETTDPRLPEGVLEAHSAWKDKTGKWTDFVKAAGGVSKAKEYREIIESDD